MIKIFNLYNIYKMVTSKKNKTRSSLMRSKGRRSYKTKNIKGGGFMINVNFQGRTTKLDVNPNDTIMSLATKIQNWCGLYAPNQDIIFNGQELSFQNTIQGSGITPNSTVQVRMSDVTIQPPKRG
jgi:hypothetical protein